MDIREINKENDIFQEILALKENRTKRQAKKSFFVEGVQNIKDADSNGWEFESLIFSNFDRLSNWSKNFIRSKQCNLYDLKPELMRKLSEKDDMSELVAVIKMKNEKNEGLSNNPIIVLLDRPSKKGNLGTIIRTCDAFNVDQILISGHGVDVYDREVIGASMGSFFKMNINHIKSNESFLDIVNELKIRYKNLQIVATSLQGEREIKNCDFSCPTLLLIGNEASGLSSFYNSLCDIKVKIPMREGIDSLNIACATSIFLYEISSQHKIKNL